MCSCCRQALRMRSITPIDEWQTDPLLFFAMCLQTPNMAICDANLVDGMPKSLTAFGGLDALVHALESYVSVCATDYTKGECWWLVRSNYCCSIYC